MKPIYLTLSIPNGSITPGGSHFWGNPDLPKEVDYPTYTDNEGDEYPYFFVCQINMEDIAPYDVDNLLPKTGLLSFFAKIDHYLGIDVPTDTIGGNISSQEAVKVMYFPTTADMREVVLIDDDGEPSSPEEMQIKFSLKETSLDDEHVMFAPPTHREWESWDHPYEEWEILLQVDSFSGEDFDLNFMDMGVLAFLISPEDLTHRNFDNVRGIVLSS